MHDTPISIIELAEYARTHPFPLEPLLRLGVIEGEATVKLEDGEVNYYKGQDQVSGVNEFNFYIHHGGNLD